MDVPQIRAMGHLRANLEYLAYCIEHDQDGHNAAGVAEILTTTGAAEANAIKLPDPLRTDCLAILSRLSQHFCDLSSFLTSASALKINRIDRESRIDADFAAAQEKYLADVEKLSGRLSAAILIANAEEPPATPPPPQTPPLTPKQVADRYNVDAGSVRRWCKAHDGQYGVSKIDGEWSIPEPAIAHTGWARRTNDKKQRAKLPTSEVWECFECNGTVSSDTKPLHCTKCQRDTAFTRPRPART